MKTIDYQKQGADFITQHGLKFRAVKKAGQCPPWSSDKSPYSKCSCGSVHGDRYLITISRSGHGRISFDFWNSLNDKKDWRAPTPYDVLACISGDVHCPDTFEDFCGEYGYDQDSRKAERVFRRCTKLAKRLRAFFTADEIEALSEIQ